MKIALTTTLPLEGFSRLKGHQIGVPIEEADIIVSTFDFPINEDLLLRAPHIRLVANFGVGYNNVDLAACTKYGIYVTNTPKPVIEPTAELCFTLMSAITRRTAELDRRLRVGNAEPIGVMHNLGHTLYGRTLGIIGMGNIGRAVARRAIASGMHIIYHNRHVLSQTHLDELGGYIPKLVSKEELIKTADFVSLNLPYTNEVYHLIDEKELHNMKPTAYLINTARGAHVNELALIRALKEHWIAGAALDVYEHEPAIHPELLQLDNVLLSPHIGTGTWEDRIAMCENVTDNILFFEKGEYSKMNIVNQ